MVTAVVCAGLDPGADAEVRRRMSRLADVGLPVRIPPRHPPHLSLAAARMPTEQLPDLAAVVCEAAASLPPFALELDHLGSFPRGGVLWLGPAPTPALADLQRKVDAALLAAGWPRAFGERSSPDRWIGHCTLATRLDAAGLGRAVSELARGFRPVRARVPELITILVGGAEKHRVALAG